MSIRFPTDNDAGMPSPSGPRKRGGGGRFLFMLMLGVIAFMIIRGMSSAPRNSIEPPAGDRNGEYGSTSFPELEPNQPRDDQNDWGMDDGPVQRNADSKKPNTKSSGSDWGMEDVATQRDAQKPAGRFSQSSPASVKKPENKKPVTQGNWSLEEVDTTPKSSTPKKTTKGDWGLEEVD